MKRHYRDDPEWAEEVIRRWHRRRDLPRRQLVAALEEAVMPMVEWFDRHQWAIVVLGGVAIGVMVWATITGQATVR